MRSERAICVTVSKVNAQELAKMRKVFRKMTRDGRVRCVGL
jgi:hypothetical protein